MEESKPMSQQQQQQQQQQHHQFLVQQLQKHQLQAQGQQQHQQQQQQQRQQQLLLLQQLQKQQQQQAAISRFPSNIDAHLRPPGFIPNRPVNLPQQNLNPNPNASPSPSLTQQTPNLQQQNQQISQQQKAVRPLNHLELQFAYQDAWRVCHPDFKRPFSSLEDACERLLPYHVVADYEAEEDDRILDSDTTGQALSRSQQWDNNIAAKVAEFTATFEKQVLAFNIISRKRMAGEFRSEERLMIEQALLQEEKKALFELRAEMESKEKAGREAHEAKLRTAVMAQMGQIGAGTHAHAEILARNPLRPNALGNQGNNNTLGHEMGEQGQSMNPDEMMNGWGSNTQRDEDPSDDFLNDEENENGDMGEQENSREGGEFDLNTR